MNHEENIRQFLKMLATAASTAMKRAHEEALVKYVLDEFERKELVLAEKERAIKRAEAKFINQDDDINSLESALLSERSLVAGLLKDKKELRAEIETLEEKLENKRWWRR